MTASSYMRSRCGMYQRQTRSSSAGHPGDLPPTTRIVSTKDGHASAAAAGGAKAWMARSASGDSAMWARRRAAVAGPTPGKSCITRNPATRSRAFSAQRRNAKTSLICAASRNFSPPNFTKRGGFCDAMRMVEVGHGPSEALQKPSMHETAGHESSYGYLIQLVAARLRGSKKRTQRASLGTTANWVFCKLRGLLIGVLLHRSRSTGTAWAEHGRRHDGG